MDIDSYSFEVNILPQPNDTTCGPTCLHAVYEYYGDHIDLPQLIKEVHALEGGGTLAVLLACHALKRGYEATIYTYNLHVFDPSWFEPGIDLAKKLSEQMACKNNPKLLLASTGYLEFLSLGGTLKMVDLSRDLIRMFLFQDTPILTGLSSTFLYRTKREHSPAPHVEVADDLLGEPSGHFVILCGYDREKQMIKIADPLSTNPYSPTQKYEVSLDRTLCSILLGILTYDANFLIIKPKKSNNLPSHAPFLNKPKEIS
jgi:hypothetical protein